MPDFTITITVNTATTPPTLIYTGSGSGGATNGPKSHKVHNGNDLYFECPDGDLLIQFKNPANKNKRPFSNAGVNAIRDAVQGTKTTKLSLKSGNTPDTINYTAVVAKGAGAPLMVWEDPELEVGPDSGGPPPAKKTAPKKKGSKKKKK